MLFAGILYGEKKYVLVIRMLKTINVKMNIYFGLSSSTKISQKKKEIIINAR